VNNQGEKEVRTGLIGNPTILIVDDEEMMREVTVIMIEDNGGRALTAEDGHHAVQVFREHRDEIDCVFMDFSMPNMNGYEAYCEIEKIKSGVDFMMVSGLTVTPEVAELQRMGKITFLNKPFQEAQLISTINRLRNNRNEGS